ncbi:hypothetical protein Tco_0899472 [Tanacetum coccineum]
MEHLQFLPTQLAPSGIDIERSSWPSFRTKRANHPYERGNGLFDFTEKILREPSKSPKYLTFKSRETFVIRAFLRLLCVSVGQSKLAAKVTEKNAL